MGGSLSSMFLSRDRGVGRMWRQNHPLAVSPQIDASTGAESQQQQQQQHRNSLIFINKEGQAAENFHGILTYNNNHGNSNSGNLDAAHANAGNGVDSSNAEKSSVPVPPMFIANISDDSTHSGSDSLLSSDDTPPSSLMPSRRMSQASNRTTRSRSSTKSSLVHSIGGGNGNNLLDTPMSSVNSMSTIGSNLHDVEDASSIMSSSSKNSGSSKIAKQQSSITASNQPNVNNIVVQPASVSSSSSPPTVAPSSSQRVTFLPQTDKNNDEVDENNRKKRTNDNITLSLRRRWSLPKQLQRSQVDELSSSGEVKEIKQKTRVVSLLTSSNGNQQGMSTTADGGSIRNNIAQDSDLGSDEENRNPTANESLHQQQKQQRSKKSSNTNTSSFWWGMRRNRQLADEKIVESSESLPVSHSKMDSNDNVSSGDSRSKINQDGKIAGSHVQSVTLLTGSEAALKSSLLQVFQSTQTNLQKLGSQITRSQSPKASGIGFLETFDPRAGFTQSNSRTQIPNSSMPSSSSSSSAPSPLPAPSSPNPITAQGQNQKQNKEDYHSPIMESQSFDQTKQEQQQPIQANHNESSRKNVEQRSMMKIKTETQELQQLQLQQQQEQQQQQQQQQHSPMLQTYARRSSASGSQIGLLSQKSSSSVDSTKSAGPARRGSATGGDIMSNGNNGGNNGGNNNFNGLRRGSGSASASGNGNGNGNGLMGGAKSPLLPNTSSSASAASVSASASSSTSVSANTSKNMNRKNDNEHLDSQGFEREIKKRIVPAVYQPGEFIIRKGEIGNEMYFLSRGTVNVTSRDGKRVYSTIQQGSFFGELGVVMTRMMILMLVGYVMMMGMIKESRNHAR